MLDSPFNLLISGFSSSQVLLSTSSKISIIIIKTGIIIIIATHAHINNYNAYQAHQIQHSCQICLSLGI